MFRFAFKSTTIQSRCETLIRSRIFLSKIAFVEPFGVSLSGMPRLSAPIGSTIWRSSNSFTPGASTDLRFPSRVIITLEKNQVFAQSHPTESFDFQQGADDDQLAAASRLAALVVRYWNDPTLMQVVEQATRVCQNKNSTVGYMKFNALLLSELFNRRDVHTAIRRAEEQTELVEPQFGQEIRRQTRLALEETLNDVIEATLTFGQACPLPDSFPSAIHALLKHSDDFESAILAVLSAGGDSAGRASMVGAWLGAHLGIAAIPKAWRVKLTQAVRISTAIEKILADRAKAR
jgi:ADP-ribosyl-[dinitrogen reductase] hydrolase